MRRYELIRAHTRTGLPHMRSTSLLIAQSLSPPHSPTGQDLLPSPCGHVAHCRSRRLPDKPTTHCLTLTAAHN
jgi:hypothetical protein